MNKTDKTGEIVKITDDVECVLMYNGWDYAEEAKHVVFGDGKGIDIYLCTQEPFEINGRTCISACWEPPCDVDDLISPNQWETLSEFLQETVYTIDADINEEGDVRDGAWDELVEQAKNESHKLFEKINSAA